jgi:hypothetical protein
MKAAGPRANNPSKNQDSIISVKILSQLTKLQLHVCYAWFYAVLAQWVDCVKVRVIFLGKAEEHLQSRLYSFLAV